MTTAAPVRPLENAHDRTLAGRAADGDVRAFEVLVRRYGPLMRAYAVRILQSNDESDDVLQESFIVAWRQLPDLDDGGVVKSWLMRIVSRKCLDRIRARREHVDIDDVQPAAPASQSPPRLAEVHSTYDALGVALRTLPENQRECWVLREIAEYSYEDIGEAIGVPASTVRGLLARARKNLIHQMEVWR